MTDSTSGSPKLSRSIRILMGEDNPQDLFLLEESFATEKLPVVIECVEDGESLLQRLRSMDGNRQDGEPAVDLVLLDLHLPRRSAEDVLKMLRQEKRDLRVPVFVLTSTISQEQRSKLESLGVGAVLSKPMDLTEYLDLARRLHSAATESTS